MSDPHRDAKKEPLRKRLRSWFLALGVKGRTITIASGVIKLLFIIFSIVAIGLTAKSLTSDDLSLYLEADTSTLALHPGDSGSVAVVMSAKNLPFCTAHCTYSATDRLSGTVIAEDDVTLITSIDQSVMIPYTAPATYERDGLLTIALMCSNEASSLCKSDGTARYNTATVRVLSRYTDEQLAARNRFVTAAPARSDALSTWFASTIMLSRSVGDRRVSAIATQARTDAATLNSTLAALTIAVERESFEQAETLLASFADPLSLLLYADARATETDAVTEFNRLSAAYTDAVRLAPLLSTSDVTQLAAARSQLIRIHDGFASSDLDVTKRLLEVTNTTLTSVTANASTPTVLTSAEVMLTGDETLRCSLYASVATACPPAPIDTNASTLQRLTSYCAASDDSNDRFTTNRLAYARDTLADLNATVADALIALNVSDVTQQPTFASWRAVTLDALRAGTPLTLTPAETLALNPAPRNSSINCTLPFALPIPTPSATLPVLDPLVSDVLFPSPTPRQCCDDGHCVACPAEQPTPVVFVHGFSFAQGTSPESNLNAFGPLARLFDSRNTARYVGHIFPQENIAEDTFTSVAGLPGRYAMTATYYYDSYSQDGKLSLVAQKTENLETYAIRLREAIAVAKARTGEDKVIIVVHSMGGLVTRRYLQLFGEDSVVAVNMIGTPNNGITGRTQQFCGVLGSELECRDMEAGSLFMTKLTNGKKPKIPVYTIAGIGCDMGGEEGDGIITRSSVALPWATNVVVNGTCSGLSALHSTLLDPSLYPDVADTVEGLVQKY